ncbi:MAG: hypothetical protein KAS40_21150 [Desulfobacterales bacterium]|nr:hypothetical protein [Desulfobacterales bacterium]
MRIRKIFKIYLILNFIVFSLAACRTGIPKEALMLSPESLKDRQLQTRIFETDNEESLLTAAAAVLQDTGFTIEDSETECGLIVFSRDRDVTDYREVMQSIALMFVGINHPHAKTQKVLASLVTKPLDNKRIAVRITFLHIVWNKDNVVMKKERLNDFEIYQEFFSKLSKSVFLVAHEI